ncbi:peptidase U32 family protein [Uliginosibacterium sp. H1]|uniref:peptidase U32 family protein n=1 Tax=Uliginosibacterium sp. H1 TaxID=3114757 RepID=UPI002E1756E0|nr:U32 family peptidase [Uliginosibacterium sp. H1]
MSLAAHQLELLSPARSAEIGREAVLHGADAVYIGGPAFGARTNAENTVSEIAGLVEFAHRYGSRIMVTLNTILHDSELDAARRLVREYYDAGVDALIVQDMALLEMDLPPIQLHASTQCDIRTVEKAKFLSQVGFSQIVLARELTLDKIRAIHDAIDPAIALEFFIHGALCVAFSGNCYISHAHSGRSANRGSCSQDCRLPYTLEDAQGRVVAYDKHLLSMKDNDQSANLRALVDAGIRSFKIEGRYKDMSYVKNITAHYRLLLDEILNERPELAKSSHGASVFGFTPETDKTFNRSATDYFVTGRKIDIGAFDAPTHVGLPLGTVTKIGPDWFELAAIEPLANSDGLTYMNKREVRGMQANVVKKLGTRQDEDHAGNRIELGVWRVEPNQAMKELAGLRVGTAISRNRDHAWEQALLKKSSERRIAVDLLFAETSDGFSLTLTDETGACAYVAIDHDKQPAQQAERAESGLRDNLAKLGTTIFSAREIDVVWAQPSQPLFLPASAVNTLRRDGVAALEAERLARLPRWTRTPAVQPPVAYPETSLSYLANVYNDAARAFYTKHGVGLIDAAYEAHEEDGEVSVMVTKHCLRFSFNLCPKQAKGVQGVQGQVRAEPMTLINGNERMTLRFDCKPCEMHVVSKMKKHIFNSPPPSTVESPLTFHRVRPTH